MNGQPTAKLTDSAQPDIVRPGSAELLALDGLFLCDSENYDFLKGKTQKPAGGGNAVLGLLLIPLLLLVVIPLLWGSDGLASLLLQISHHSTEGTVTDTRSAKRARERGAPETVYFISYSFVANGLVYFGENEVDQAVYDRYSLGSHIKVAYFPGHPNISHITKYSLTESLLLTVLGLLAIPVLTYAAYFSHKLNKDGQLLPGKVTEWVVKKPSMFKPNAPTKVTMKYPFQNPDGRVVTGNKTIDLEAEIPITAKYGDPVAILYLNDRHYVVL
jgi:hypothetical protein